MVNLIDAIVLDRIIIIFNDLKAFLHPFGIGSGIFKGIEAFDGKITQYEYTNCVIKCDAIALKRQLPLTCQQGSCI